MKNDDKVVNIKNKEANTVASVGYDIHITMYNDTVTSYRDILGYQVGNQWVAVSLKDGTTYAHPASAIVLIQHTPSKAE